MGRRKSRLNLYIDGELLGFAKKWSYVSGKPISGMLEEYLLEEQERVMAISPFKWLDERDEARKAPGEAAAFAELEAYLKDWEEAEFCRQNPDHPRAAVRRRLQEEFERKRNAEMEGRKLREREFISRWLKVFPVK